MAAHYAREWKHWVESEMGKDPLFWEPSLPCRHWAGLQQLLQKELPGPETKAAVTPCLMPPMLLLMRHLQIQETNVVIYTAAW